MEINEGEIVTQIRQQTVKNRKCLIDCLSIPATKRQRRAITYYWIIDTVNTRFLPRVIDTGTGIEHASDYLAWLDVTFIMMTTSAENKQTRNLVWNYFKRLNEQMKGLMFPNTKTRSQKFLWPNLSSFTWERQENCVFVILHINFWEIVQRKFVHEKCGVSKHLSNRYRRYLTPKVIGIVSNQFVVSPITAETIKPVKSFVYRF